MWLIIGTIYIIIITLLTWLSNYIQKEDGNMDKQYKVQVKDLHKSYGKNEVLQGINLNVLPAVVCMMAVWFR